MLKALKAQGAVILSIALVFCSSVSASAAYVISGDTVGKAGDANQDRFVNVKDMVRVKKIIAGLDEAPITSDLNGNGETDSGDLMYIRSIILDIDESQWTGIL